MERQRFAQHLELATRSAIDSARSYVTNELRGEVSYLVKPNQSCDETLREDEVVFPGDSLPRAAHHGPWSAERIVEFLWRDGHVPEWIDIAVVEVPEPGAIRLELSCCGRFTTTEELLYYADGPVPPFGVKSPVLPPKWTDGDSRLDVNWRRDRVASVARQGVGMSFIPVAVACIVHVAAGLLLYRGRVQTDLALLNSDLLVFAAPAVVALFFNWIVLRRSSQKRALRGGKAGAPLLIALVITFAAHCCYLFLALNLYGS